MYNLGSALPMRKVSPLVKPAIPLAELMPEPPAISGLKYKAAFFHNFLPRKRVVVTDNLLLSEVFIKLLAPEYLAVKEGCVWLIAVS